MKCETTNTILTFILGALVLLGVVFALKTINHTREMRLVANRATELLREQAFFNNCFDYGKTHPDINHILQPLLPKPAAH